MSTQPEPALVDALAYALARAPLPGANDTSRDYAERLAPLVIESGWLATAAARAEVARQGDAAKLREALEDMVNQFGYWSDGETPGLWSGGLSALEGAFAALDWDEPHPAPWQQCEAPGCRKQSSMGTPTPYGYKRLCGDHGHPVFNGDYSALEDAAPRQPEPDIEAASPSEETR